VIDYFGDNSHILEYDDCINFGDYSDDSDTEAFIEKLLEELPVTDQKIIKLFYFKKLSHQAIAAKLGLKTSYVKERKYLIVEGWRKMYGGMGGILEMQTY